MSVFQQIFDSWGWNWSQMFIYGPYYPFLAITLFRPDGPFTHEMPQIENNVYYGKYIRNIQNNILRLQYNDSVILRAFETTFQFCPRLFASPPNKFFKNSYSRLSYQTSAEEKYVLLVPPSVVPISWNDIANKFWVMIEFYRTKITAKDVKERCWFYLQVCEINVSFVVISIHFIVLRFSCLYSGTQPKKVLPRSDSMTKMCYWKTLPFFTRLRSRRVVMCLVVVYVRSFVRSFIRSFVRAFVRSFPHTTAGI